MYNYKTETLIIGIIVLILIIGVFLRMKSQDINFTRQVFAGLTQGTQSVQDKIDWENLQAVGIDVGKTYIGLANEKEKEDYRKTFIEKFSFGFRQTKGRFRSFINWRIYEQQAEFTIVAADYKAKKNKTILFTLAKNGLRRLTAIQWKEDADASR